VAITTETSNSEAGKSRRETAMNFVYEVSNFTLVVFFIMPKNRTTWDPGFTSPPKEVLRIFIAIRNPSSTAGFGPANLGSGGSHSNH
jgi:hypothetical protein